MDRFGVVAFVAQLLPGLLLIVVGMLGVRRRQGVMMSGLSVMVITIGVSLEALLIVSVAAQPLADMTLPLMAAGAFALAGLVLWMTVLVDCLVGESREGKDRRIWATVIIFTFLVGAILYCLIRRPRRLAERGS